MMEKPNSEQWVYKGLSLLKGGKKLGHMWVPPTGKELIFAAKRERYAVGSTYTANVVRTDDGVTLHGTPRFAVVGTPDPTWVADSRSAEAVLECQRAEKRAKGAANLDALTIGDARAMMRHQLPHQRAGTLAAILLALGI